MKWVRGTLFLAFTGMVLIILFTALTAAIITSPPQQSAASEIDEGPLLGSTGDMPEIARPITKSAIYPGISKTYAMNGKPIASYNTIYHIVFEISGEQMTLNDDGTISMNLVDPRGTRHTITGGQWYQVKGKGHQIYFVFGGGYRDGDAAFLVYDYKGTIDIVNRDGKDYFHVLDNDFTGCDYNAWDAGYAAMAEPADVLGPYIDACVPADTARPYIKKGYTAGQAVPYIYYNMPIDTAEYYANLGIIGDLCGPYYAAGVSREDTVTYLDAGVIYDLAKPYVDAKAPANIAAPYAESSFTPAQCMPYVNAGIELSKARPFLFFNMPSDQAIVYINNGITASVAKPYVDAGVPAEKAVDEIKQGLPPTI
ncbi:hypothetical protein [Methanocella sp. MCL-LM]|uniref:hypothetical protein n=1 Tax=Methanocella sp. MCL-LM TaxID=3412035 RepID=UPI003C75EEB2